MFLAAGQCTDAYVFASVCDSSALAPHRMRRTRQYPSEPIRPRSRDTHRSHLGNQSRVAWIWTYRPRVAWIWTYGSRVAWISGTSSREDVLWDIRPQMGMIFRVPAVCVNCVDCAAEFPRKHGGAPAAFGHPLKFGFPMHDRFPLKDVFVV